MYYIYKFLCIYININICTYCDYSIICMLYIMYYLVNVVVVISVGPQRRGCQDRIKCAGFHEGNTCQRERVKCGGEGR